MRIFVTACAKSVSRPLIGYRENRLAFPVVNAEYCLQGTLFYTILIYIHIQFTVLVYKEMKLIRVLIHYIVKHAYHF